MNTQYEAYYNQQDRRFHSLISIYIKRILQQKVKIKRLIHLKDKVKCKIHSRLFAFILIAMLVKSLQ